MKKQCLFFYPKRVKLLSEIIHVCTLNLPLVLSGLHRLTYVTRPKQFNYLLFFFKC